MIIPCYQVADHLPAMLVSLRRNLDPAFEFILVDDGSTDATPALLARAAAELPGARVLTNATNRGLAAARNVGLDAALGEYITFLDGDDFLAAGYYATLLGAIRRLGCDLVRTDHVQVRGRRRTVHRINHGPRGVVMPPRQAILPADRPTSVDAPYAWAGIYHRRLADEGLLHFPETLRTCEDRPWNWRLHLRASSFAVVGLLGLFYRREVSTSLTQVTDGRQLDFIPAHDQIIAEVSADPEAERLLPKAVRSYCAIICHHLSRADRYGSDLAAELQTRCAQAVRRLPPDVLAEVTSRLDPRRAMVVADLRAAA